MIKHYLKIGLRSLYRYREYAAINILGLAVGIACCLLIMLFVRNEFGYDRIHAKASRIYRTWQHESYQGHDFINVQTSLPMGPALQSSYPEIQAMCRVDNFNSQVRQGEQSFSENLNMVDSSFFRIFDFTLVKGNRANPFPDIHSVLLTPEIARKYFGQTDPVGKTLEIQLGENFTPFLVTGIVNKAPEESSISYGMLISFDNAPSLFRKGMFHSWTNVMLETYVLLREGTRAAGLEKKFPVMLRRELGTDYTPESFKIFLQPLLDIHLNNILPAGNLPISNPKYSYILSTIGILILLLACINFITLSVGRSVTRAMEVGVRKVLGAERLQLVRQFWGEALLLTLLSVLIGLGLAQLLIGPFDRLTGKQLALGFDPVFIGFCLLLVLVIGLVAGIYPALILSGFNPIEALKGKMKSGVKAGIFRRSLIVGQFVIAICMIASTLLIGKQMKFLQDKDLGYRKDQVVIVPTNKSLVKGMALAGLYMTELKKYPQVEDAAASVMSFMESPWATMGYTDNNKVYRDFQFNVIDPRFLEVMHVQLTRGRNFDKDNTADIFGSILVNEALVKEYGWKDPIGQKLPGPYAERVIGVTRDFNYESLHSSVKPLVLALRPDSIFRHSEDVSFVASPQPRISVRLRPGSLVANIESLKQAWAQVAPGQDFEYHFLDDAVAAQYEQEQRTSTMIRYASALSIFIACMGLFGLATLSVARRTKEIGIRKVLGARIGGLIGLLSRDFVRLLVLAALIALPISWWALNNWLDNFAFKTSLSWWLFAGAGGIALVIALLPVGYQALRAAIMNPVKSLRTE
jgi:putative ABC transport system permease protein